MTPQQLHIAASEIVRRAPGADLVVNKVGHLEIRTTDGAIGVLDLHDGSVDWWRSESEPAGA